MCVYFMRSSVAPLGVIRLVTFLFVLPLCVVVSRHHVVVLAQVHHRSASRSQLPAVADPSTRQLAELIASQRQALQAGDPASIAEATRPLAAYVLREMAKLRLVQGSPEQSVNLYRKSLQLQPSIDGGLELASTLLRTGHPQEAGTEAAVVLQSDPRNASAWAISGSAFRSQGDEERSIDAFSHSLEIKPDANVAYVLASALLAHHEKERADRIFRQIITASGNAPIWHVAAGDAYREALYLNDAVEEFRKAIALDPAIGHAEFFLGLTFLQLNEWGPSSQSFEHLRAAVRLAPRDYLSNFYLGALESTDGSDLASSNRHLQVASQANPKSPEVWLYLGLNAAREKNTANAETYLRKAIELTGTDEARNNYQIRRVYAVLGRILINEGNHLEGDALLAKYRQSEHQSIGNSSRVIERAAEAGDARSALSGMSGGIPAPKLPFPGMNSSDPASSGTVVTPVNSDIPKRSPQEASQLADTEGRLGELLAGSFNDLGTAEARQGNYVLALEHFQEAEHWHTPTPDLLHNIGTAAFRVGDFNESARALELYLKAVKNAPHVSAQDDRSYMMLAMSLFSLGRFAEADKQFTSIPSMTSQDPRAAYSWAYSLAHSGQQQHANQIADALSKQELPSDVMSLVCHLYMDTENYDRSVACFREAYQANPNLLLAHYQVAESLIRLDRSAEAIPELKQELLLTPDSSDVQYSLAFAYLQTAHKSEAMQILKQLTLLHPTHAQAQYQLGKALLEQGETTEAVSHLELAERNDPEPDYIHYQLQVAYRKAGRIEDADRELALYRNIKSRKREVTTPH